MAKEDAASRRVATVPSIGVTNAAALVAAVGMRGASSAGVILRLGSASRPARRAPRASRDCSASRNGAIDICARTSSIAPGAVLPAILAQDTPLGRWAHRNIVVGALAAKLARIVWTVLRRERPFDPAVAAA